MLKSLYVVAAVAALAGNSNAENTIMDVLEKDISSFNDGVTEWTKMVVGEESFKTLETTHHQAWNVSPENATQKIPPACADAHVRRITKAINEVFEGTKKGIKAVKKLAWHPSHKCLESEHPFLKMGGGASAGLRITCDDSMLLEVKAGGGGGVRFVDQQESQRHHWKYAGGSGLTISLLDGRIVIVGGGAESWRSGLVFSSFPDGMEETIHNVTTAMQSCAANKTLLIQGLGGGGWNVVGANGDFANSESFGYGFGFELGFNLKEESEATESPTVAPAVVETTEAPEATTEAPETATTEAPEATTTEEPEATTTEAPEATTTEAPEATTTEAPEATTTEAPEATTTEEPEATTEEPETTTTEEPETTTTEEPEATTEAPETTTTEAPEATTTEAPEATTTEEPEATTTEEPEATTNEEPTTSAPEVPSTATVPEANTTPDAAPKAKDNVAPVNALAATSNMAASPRQLPSSLLDETTKNIANTLQSVMAKCINDDDNTCTTRQMFPILPETKTSSWFIPAVSMSAEEYEEVPEANTSVASSKTKEYLALGGVAVAIVAVGLYVNSTYRRRSGYEALDNTV